MRNEMWTRLQSSRPTMRAKRWRPHNQLVSIKFNSIKLSPIYFKRFREMLERVAAGHSSCVVFLSSRDFFFAMVCWRHRLVDSHLNNTIRLHSCLLFCLQSRDVSLCKWENYLCFRNDVISGCCYVFHLYNFYCASQNQACDSAV